MRVLLAVSILLASLVTLPYILRAWPGLPWEVVRVSFVVAVVLLVVVADRVYVVLRAKSGGGSNES